MKRLEKQFKNQNSIRPLVDQICLKKVLSINEIQKLKFKSQNYKLKFKSKAKKF